MTDNIINVLDQFGNEKELTNDELMFIANKIYLENYESEKEIIDKMKNLKIESDNTCDVDILVQIIDHLKNKNWKAILKKNNGETYKDVITCKCGGQFFYRCYGTWKSHERSHIHKNYTRTHQISFDDVRKKVWESHLEHYVS